MAQPRFGSSTFGQAGAPKGPDYRTSSSPAPPNPLELGSARGATEFDQPTGSAKTCICPVCGAGISEDELRAQGFIPATSGSYKGNPEPDADDLAGYEGDHIRGVDYGPGGDDILA